MHLQCGSVFCKINLGVLVSNESAPLPPVPPNGYQGGIKDSTQTCYGVSRHSLA